MSLIICVRHGESQWNLENRFTGWTDVPLSPKGELQARQVGQWLKQQALEPSVAFTSFLRRAIETCQIILQESGCHHVSVLKNWRLNERHYGALQGLNKEESQKQFGSEVVHRWRRGLFDKPPAVLPEDPRHPSHDKRYQGLEICNQSDFSESLWDVAQRLKPWILESLLPATIQHEVILIVAHGNSLRALVYWLLELTPEDIVRFEFPTGVPYLIPLQPHWKVDPSQVRWGWLSS